MCCPIILIAMTVCNMTKALLYAIYHSSEQASFEETDYRLVFGLSCDSN